jgi:uncharacterized protein (TIGR02996 family)
MSPDDEAFIRQIVDNPGDDTPRLVYADWLDENGDPRGVYLRAEVASSRARKNETANLVKFMATGLDPVWVARVSRPPLGVCSNRIQLAENAGPVLTAADISEFESRRGFRLGLQHRSLLLNWNGCNYRPSECFIRFGPTAQKIEINVQEFCSLDRLAMIDGPEIRFTPLLAINVDHYGTNLLLGVQGPASGKVFYRDMYYYYDIFDHAEPLLVANSLGQFLHKLTTPSSKK